MNVEFMIWKASALIYSLRVFEVMFDFSLQRVVLTAFCWASLTSCNASTDNTEFKALEAKLAAAQAEVIQLKTEIATLKSRQVGIVCGKGDDALLTQSGDLSAVKMEKSDDYCPSLK